MEDESRTRRTWRKVFRSVPNSQRLHNIAHNGHEIATIVTTHVAAILVIDQSHMLFVLLGVSH